MNVLDTATLQFTRMDLPPLLAEQDDRECAFVLGNTKDGRPCIVSPDLWGDCSLNVLGSDGRLLDSDFRRRTILIIDVRLFILFL